MRRMNKYIVTLLIVLVIILEKHYYNILYDKAEKLNLETLFQEEIPHSNNFVKHSSFSSLNLSYSSELANNATLPPHFTSSYFMFVHSLPASPDDFFEYYKYIEETNAYKLKGQRILCYKPNDAGLANRLNGLINTLYIAMLTNRIFYICDWPAFSSYFQLSISIPHISTKDLPYYKQYTYGPKCPFFKDLSENSFDTLFPEDILVIVTNCKLLFSYRHNEDYKNLMTYIGFTQNYVKDQDYPLFIHHYFLTHVLFPSKTIQDQIKQQQQTLFQDPSIRYLGVQLRTGENEHKSNKNLPFNKNSTIDNVFSQVLKYSKQLESHNITYKWFLITDSLSTKKSIIKQYPKLVLTYNSQLVHSASHSIKEYSQSTVDAIIELYLLGSCYEIFVTYGSSFGGFARSILGKGKLY